jgi:thiosulfate reductase cytochrome b subunit
MKKIYRHGFATRFAHWLWALAILVLVMSGLQIFNAAPYLDASDKSDAAHRVLAFGAHLQNGVPVGTTAIFGHTFVTTGWLGYTDDGLGGKAARAFPAWLTLPGPQDLAGGRAWHFFFAWMLVLALAVVAIASATRRRSPGYEPLQRGAYRVVLAVLFPLVVLTGLALSPGVDSAAPWLTALFGGRQFARLWHFVVMGLLVAFTFGHLFKVATTGVWNNMRSMFTGWYAEGEAAR